MFPAPLSFFACHTFPFHMFYFIWPSFFCTSSVFSSSCGVVEDVVGALTSVGSGVAQVFHDLVELQMLLVAEVEERDEEDRQEEGEKIKGGNHVEETTTTWMAMVMVVSGVRTRLELEPK